MAQVTFQQQQQPRGFCSNVRAKITRQSVKFIMHLTGAVMFTYAIYYDCKYVFVPETLVSKNVRTRFGGRFKFLTFWDAILQMVYFQMALADDLYEFYQNQPNLRLRKIKDYMFSSIGFPIGIFVCTFFWTLYGIDRELIFPRIMDQVIPSWLNHFMHTYVGIFPILEIILATHELPDRKYALAGHLTFTLSYVNWLYYINYRTGIWVYPVLKVMKKPERAVFLAAGVLLGVFWYFVGEILQCKLHGNRAERDAHKSE